MTRRGETIDRRFSRSRLLQNNLVASAVIFLLLEIWRPCFFLTDDNLTGGFPIFTEIGHHLLHGQSPFVSDYLFGGNYPLLDDATFFAWHPIYLLSSLLVATPAHFWIMEVSAFFFLMVATAGFVNLAYFLRNELSLDLSDGWLMFYTLSFTYTFMALATGASWLSFLGNHSALPWLTLGILQKSWRRGLGLVTLFSLHHILGGHLAPFMTITLFLCFFALAIAFWRRSIVPLISWLVGTGLALLIVLPLLLPAFHGFFVSARSHGVTIDLMQNARIPPIFFPGSYFLGTAFWLLKHPSDYHVYHPALAACAASWCIIPAFLGRSKWRFLEVLCLGLMAIVLVLIMRPFWISEVMLHVPLLRSLKFPFRELLIFHLFLHLFFILRPPGLSVDWRRFIAVGGSAIFLLPMLSYAPPSFNPLPQQRHLLLSGELEKYWDRVRPLLKPDDRVAMIIPNGSFRDTGDWAPFALMGTHNFCCLLRFKNASGYSVTAPEDKLYVHTPSPYSFGAFLPEQEDQLWRERPNLKMMILDRLHPLKLTLRSREGPDIDLTPYLPPDVASP